MQPLDWNTLFSLDTPVAEIVVRGSIVYLSLFLLLRFVLKRQAGAVGITDLLVVVLIADAAQNSMAGDSRSVPAGLLLVATIAFWSYAFDWMGHRFAWFERVVHPPPLPLVRDGKVLRRNLRQEMITMQELESQLREQGVGALADVKSACMEGDGKISVITREKEPARGTPETQTG
jgi:uncharacterized membrane protein YcaP (DUF421 family)